MEKPKNARGYDVRYTDACERLLVTLLRGIGPYRDMVFLVGGLTPRYIVPQTGAGIPLHTGTMDVDVVVQLEILTDVDAYQTLEQNLRRNGFERGTNAAGNKVSWRWERRHDDGVILLLELLVDEPSMRGGRVRELPEEKGMSALNIPYSSMVFDFHDTKIIRAELLNDGGIAEVTVRHADIVSFICLKAIAYADRNEPKDSYDIVYCLTHYPGGPEAAAKAFASRLAEGKHGAPIQRALEILAKCYVTDAHTDGYRKDGPVAYSRFQLHEDEVSKDARVRLQRMPPAQWKCSWTVLDSLVSRRRF